MKIKNQKLTNDAFFAEREEVLQQWLTGKGVDLDEAIDYQKKIPDAKRFGNVLDQGVENKETLIQPEQEWRCKRTHQTAEILGTGGRGRSAAYYSG